MAWAQSLTVSVFAVVLVGAGAAALAQPAASDVAVFGSQSTQPVTENGVVVYRGPASPAPNRVGVGTKSTPTVLAGRQLWLIDRDTGRVIGCSLRSSGHVGRKAIRCGDRSLAGIVDR